MYPQLPWSLIVLGAALFGLFHIAGFQVTPRKGYYPGKMTRLRHALLAFCIVFYLGFYAISFTVYYAFIMMAIAFVCGRFAAALVEHFLPLTVYKNLSLWVGLVIPVVSLMGILRVYHLHKLY